MINIGIIREGKQPPDLRTPLIPEQCIQLKNYFPEIEIFVQHSQHRCYSDASYQNKEINVVEDLSHCDIIIGVKEIPIDMLLENKTYLFFSHTIKKQLHNRNLLREILKKKIRLIDYETLVWEAGNRIIGFGRFAGIVGTHHAFRMWGLKHHLFELKPAYKCLNMEEMYKQYKSIEIPKVKIVLCGDGRVAHGSIEVLRYLKIRQVSAEEFLNHTYDEPVFVQLRSEDYYQHKNNRHWDKSDFYKHPEDYVSTFKPYYQQADIMINAIFWKEGIPAFFSHEDMKSKEFNIRVISDITCDIPGPLPCTLKSTSINEPYFGYNPYIESISDAFGKNTIDVQAVSNLPCELPIDASQEFGEMLIRHVLPYLIENDSEGIIENATIASGGKLMPKFQYLKDYVE